MKYSDWADRAGSDDADSDNSTALQRWGRGQPVRCKAGGEQWSARGGAARTDQSEDEQEWEKST
jgi:hypothetical protein